MSVLWRKCWFRDLSVVFVLAQKPKSTLDYPIIINYPFCQMPSCSWMSLNEAAISTVLIGSCIWLVGRLKLARLVKACPFVIYGGFMAGTGAVGAWEKGQKAKRQRQKTTKQLSNFGETISAFQCIPVHSAFSWEFETKISGEKNSILWAVRFCCNTPWIWWPQTSPAASTKSPPNKSGNFQHLFWMKWTDGWLSFGCFQKLF